MLFSSIIALLFPLCAFTHAHSCASWVLPADCLKEAAAFSERMKTAKSTPMTQPDATEIPNAEATAISPDPSSAPPSHRNCGTLGIMDANDAPCDRMYRPGAQPSPVPAAVLPPAPQVEAEKEKSASQVEAEKEESASQLEAGKEESASQLEAGKEESASQLEAEKEESASCVERMAIPFQA